MLGSAGCGFLKPALARRCSSSSYFSLTLLLSHPPFLATVGALSLGFDGVLSIPPLSAIKLSRLLLGLPKPAVLSPSGILEAYRAPSLCPRAPSPSRLSSATCDAEIPSRCTRPALVSLCIRLPPSTPLQPRASPSRPDGAIGCLVSGRFNLFSLSHRVPFPSRAVCIVCLTQPPLLPP